MYSLSDCQKIIEKRINQLSLNNSPQELYDPIRYILSNGGKRIRPSLVLLAYNMFSDSIENAINPALGVEIFHNFTLLHDDIMDNAAIRRSQPTVHIKWNPNVAILSGDAMLIKAFEYIANCNCRNQMKIISIFNSTALKVCEGQQFDMNFEKTSNVSVKDYLKMIELKTAVLIAASLQIGALAAESPETDAQLLYEFGKNIGIAFQLQDDLLDVYADSEFFGKTTGGDIVSNKKTYLLIKALTIIERDDYNTLQEWISKEQFNIDEKIKVITSIFDSWHIKENTEQTINHYFKQALQALNGINVDSDKKDELKNLAKSLMGRKK
ncbi:MAG: polyprenyl synthetase family protein [Bacteroidales bacterium]|nr:polyprenyl synthetase family protein [Bacteroidales bacterium]